MAVTENLKLPDHYELEGELREQLSNRPGHQRCVEGAGELLLVVHEVPAPGIPERHALFFWKGHEGNWRQASGSGLSGLRELLDRYAATIDHHEQALEEAASAASIFAILRHAAPLARSSRNLVQALEQVLAIDSDDRPIRACRDRARELERAAELLHNEGRLALEFWRAQREESQTHSAARLNQIAFRLNMLAGFFLPLVAVGGLLGMNIDLPTFLKPWFWGVLSSGACLGAGLVWLVARQPVKAVDAGAPQAVAERPGRQASEGTTVAGSVSAS